MRSARLAAVHVAPPVENLRRTQVERIVARDRQLVGGEEVAVFRDSRHALRIVGERFLHDRVQPGHQIVFDAAHRAHRRKERVGALVHHIGDIVQVRLGDAVDARLVAGAVDDDRRMTAGEGDDGGVFALRDEVGRLHVHEHAELVRRFEIFDRRHEGVEAHEIEPELLALFRYHPVVSEIARQMDGLGEIAVLGYAAQIDRLAVEPEFLAVGDETADAELLAVRSLGGYDIKVVAPRILRHPELVTGRRKREVALAFTLGEHPASVAHRIRIGVFAGDMDGKGFKIFRRRHVHVGDIALGETQGEMAVHAAGGGEERSRRKTADIVAVAEIRIV